MLKNLIERYPALATAEETIKKATEEIIGCYEKGGKLLLCGNGGSSADCEHIAGELMKGFLKKRYLSNETKAKMKTASPFVDDELLSGLRGGLPAIPLASMTAFCSAFCNDEDPELVYAQAVMSLATNGDILIAISTSGNSRNICAAAAVAKAKGCKVIALTGSQGGLIKKYADVCICAPADETFKIQELHLPVYHCICAAVEEHFYKS